MPSNPPAHHQTTSTDEAYEVLVIGGGPVGSALALDLTWRGIRVLLAERDTIVPDEVRARGLNARTMEHFRRLGIADAIRRRDGLPRELYDTTVVATALCAAPIAVTTREAGTISVPGTDRTVPDEVAELPHILPQPQIVDVLRTRIAELGGELAIGWEVIRLHQTADHVLAELRQTTTGRTRQITALYAVGTDGARSLVRDVAGIALDATLPLGKRLSVTFHADDLHALTGAPPAARFLLPRGDGFDLLTTHAPGKWGFGLGPFPLDADLSTIDAAAEARRLIGNDAPFRIDSVRAWPVQRAVAARYRSGRLFIAGDAAHTCPPTGGQNMNTGIGDAMNLSWKLSAVLAGWAGAVLLDTYEAERLPVGQRNTTWSLENTSLQAQAAPQDAAQAEKRQSNLQRRGFGSLGGVVLDLRYASAIITDDGADIMQAIPEWEPGHHAPIAAAGHRAPHFRLADGSSLYDRLGAWHTLISFDTDAPTAQLTDAAVLRRVPLTILRLDDPQGRALYGADFVLVRPDQQIAWRGNRLPDDPAALIDRIRGESAARLLESVG